MTKNCLHCGLKILNEKFLSSNFCCAGCQNAYQIINEIGLGNYYQLKQNNPEIRNLKPEEQDETNFSSFISTSNQIHELTLAIDGLHCAACVWLIESVLKKQENVVLARINLTKKFLRLRFKGNKNQASQFVKLITQLGYKLYPFDENLVIEEEKNHGAELLKSLAVAGFGAGNIMIFSIALWFYSEAQIGTVMRDFLHILSSLIALPCIIYSSRIFFRSAINAAIHKRANMDTAISVAIFLSSAVSLYQTLNHGEKIYFDSAMMLCFFLLIGRFLDFKARKKSFDIAREFAMINSNFARLIAGEKTKIIAAKDIKKNMILLVAAGEKIPADGIIIEGQSEIDNAIISGESLPIKAFAGLEIFAGALNLNNPIKIRVTKNQDESLISKIKLIIEETQSHKNKFTKIADKLAKIYVPFVHGIAALTFIFWYFIFKSNFTNSLENAIAILIITCPCALALAVPIAQSLTISCLLKNKILLKNAEALEKIAQITTFIFDKTGTLTLGKAQLVELEGLDHQLNAQEKLFYQKLAASLANSSNHPISKAIAQFYNGEIFAPNVVEEKGFGLKADFDGDEVRLGNAEFVGVDCRYEQQRSNPPTEEDGRVSRQDCRVAGAPRNDEIVGRNSPYNDENPEERLPHNNDNQNPSQKIFLSHQNKIIVFYLRDQLKSDAKEVIATLKNQGKKIILLSGDEEKIVAQVAQNLGITEFYAKQNPLKKIEFVKKQKQFAMIGDGINDAACLDLADISFSFFSASNLTQNKADIIIQSENLSPIISFINFAKFSNSIIKQNLVFALFYNIIAIPFAFLGFITPLIAALAMSSSSIIVVLNSLRILKQRRHKV